MKKNFMPGLITLLFCGLLAAFFLLFLFAPKSDYSVYEKRYLSDAPTLNVNTLTSGSFADDAEKYAADHLPGRSFFVGLNAYYELFTGRQAAKEIWVGDSGRLYEAAVTEDDSVIERNMQAINSFADSVGQTVDLMTVPSAGYILSGDLGSLGENYHDDEILQAIRTQAGENLQWVDLLPAFTAAKDPEALYYSTDHHWTSAGTYLGYCTYLQAKGREALTPGDYTVTTASGFHGTTYSRSCLWLTPAENIELWDSGSAFEVQNSESETVSDSLFYPDRLEETDKYQVFLDGNHALVRIRSRSGSGQGKLLVIRDSFANCLGGFLAESYDEVVMVDLRYYRQPVSELAKEEDFDDILILYSIGNFMTDSNIVRLS